MNIQEILSRPYARVFLQDEETGDITGLILEFPGCVSQGSYPEEAWHRLNSAAEEWLTAHLMAGNPVPEPFESDGVVSRQSVSRLLPLWNAITKWRDKHQVSGEENLSQSDSTNEGLESLAAEALKIVGYARIPDE